MQKVNLPGFSGKPLLETIHSAISGIEFMTFQVGVSSADSAIKLSVRSQAIAFLESSGHEHALNDESDLYILVDTERSFVQSIVSSFFLEGMYNKLERGIAQTFHYCYKCKGKGCDFCSGKGKLSELSVQEALDAVMLGMFRANSSKFHGCGREDADVLMLGRGRPFVYEIIEPHIRSVDICAAEERFNSSFRGKISVHGLAQCRKARVAELKGTEFAKVYSAKCSCSPVVEKEELMKLVGDEYRVFQSTPTRVEKRRAMKNREKTVSILKASLLSERAFTLEVLASHGTYIKEFISGDDGRTSPSISSVLGKKCVCTELDVLEVRTEK